MFADNVKSTYDYNDIEYSACDDKGNIWIKNNNYFDENVIIEYCCETKDGKVLNGKQKYHIKKSEKIIANVYEICGADSKEIICLKTNIKIDNFFTNLPIYIYVMFAIVLLFTLLILFYLKKSLGKRD